MNKIHFVLIVMFYTAAVKAQNIIPYQDCKGNSPFIKKLKIELTSFAFSTSEKDKVGLVCVHPENQGKSGVYKFQHPSWSSGGFLGALNIDPLGNIFVIPTPNINTLKNPIEKNNIIYRVDNRTGIMTPLIDLPKPAPSNEKNAFGLMGIVFDCESEQLFASSIAGSTIDTEKGIIFLIGIDKNNNASIIDTLNGYDAFGLGVAKLNGEKRLFYGSTRNSYLYSIALDKENKFIGTPRIEFSIEGLGMRGDDKIKKIRFSQDNHIIIKGAEFNYNFIAPHIKQETQYTLLYNGTNKKWQLESLE